MLRQSIIFLFFFILIPCQTLPDSVKDHPNLEWNKYYSKQYDFSFTKALIGKFPVWEIILHDYKGKPNIHYLEFGVAKGGTAIWMLENILTHETARLTGIDIFPFDFQEIYLSNLKASGFAHKATTIKGYSQIELKKLPLNSYDIIYIDADHRAKAVLSDAVLSWELLKPGGLIIFDDYYWQTGDLPQELTPNLAINSFVSCYRDVLEIVHYGRQLIVRKKDDICDYTSMGCSKIGQYVYVWNYDKNNELYHKDNLAEAIKLSAKEHTLIEKLAESTIFGQTKLFLCPSITNDPDFIHLRKKLELSFDNIIIKNNCEMIKNACDPLLSEHHSLETEHADSIVSPLVVANDKNASGGKYIYSPNGTGNQYTPSSIMVTYEVNIVQAGEYILWGRVSVQDKKDNSFFIQIDNASDNLWEIETGNYWHWDVVNYRDITEPVKFILSEGKHTIKVKMREDGTKLDKLLLTNNIDFVPSGKGGLSEKQSIPDDN